jgi:hypothetical protein
MSGEIMEMRYQEAPWCPDNVLICLGNQMNRTDLKSVISNCDCYISERRQNRPDAI